MANRDLLPAGAGACRFGALRLRPLLDAFVKEIEGIRSSDDIEYVHRMRVASRRLRAALPLFEPCFPARQYKVWMGELRKITQSLGEARDTDVQIDFLRSSIKRLRKQQKRTGDNRASSPANPLADEMQVFVTTLSKKREVLQKQVVRSLDALQKSGALDGMDAALRPVPPGSPRIPRFAAAAGIPAVAAERICLRLDGMLAYEPYLSEPDAITEHHAMRIAAKKLRYTIEVYSPVYRLGLDKFHIRVKKVQEILGDIHDCDVWIDTLTAMVVKERGRSRVGQKDADPARHTLTGIRMFLHERERMRHALHRKMLQYWGTLRRKQVWEELRSALMNGRKAAFCLPTVPDEPVVLPPVLRSAEEEPTTFSHARQVTRLALELFDQTSGLHRYGSRERLLLECAGLLHDIGWKYGRRGHQAKSREMILRDERLPLDLRERSMTGIIAHAHRKELNLETDVLFTLLSEEDRRATLTLAALLRFADGMDPGHNSGVQGMNCTVFPEEIRCELVADGDVATEKVRAMEKADLMAEVFSRRVVIP